MKRTTYSIIIFLILAINATTHAAPVEVVLRAESAVEPREQVVLSDVANIVGPDAIIEEISDVTIGTAPIAGGKRTISASYISARLNTTMMGEVVSLSGPDQVTIVGRSITISAEELSDAARVYLEDQLPQDGRTYEVTVQRPPREIVTAVADDIQIEPRLLSRSIRTGPNTVAVDVLADGKKVGTTSAAMQVKAVAEVLVAVTTISQGEALTSQNTAWQTTDVTRLPNAVLADSQINTQDWQARRTIRAGSVISAGDIELPPTINRGDTVTLVVQCGNVTLRTTAEAREEGRIGDTIRVRSSVSKQDVRATIAEPGVVLINR